MNTYGNPSRRRSGFLLFSLLTLLAAPVTAQDHSGHQPAPVPEEAETADHETAHPAPAPASDTDASDPMTAMPMSHADMTAEEQPQPRDPHAYSGGYTRTTGPYALPESQQMHLADESVFTGLWVDRLETRQGESEDMHEFSGYAWLGNSYRRLLLRSELEWRDRTVEESKTELLYSRAVSPFWNLLVGARYDHGDNDHREWLALGVTGLAPYWFEINATAYLGPNGHSAASIEVEYDMLLTQRLILQPKVGLDFYGDSDLEAGHSQGLSKSKAGFRLRYEINRQFAPYLGYERVHHHGDAIELFEPFGQHRESQWIAGFRFWF